jgi:hypothetical protein
VAISHTAGVHGSVITAVLHGNGDVGFSDETFSEQASSQRERFDYLEGVVPALL